MTLKSFAERLGSIIETLQRINISFNLSKASLDPEDEFKADYLIDNLQQHVAKLLTIKVHSPEPVKQKGKAKQKQLITDNFDLEDEDFFSSPNKQKDNLDNVEIKTEITESPDKTEQNTAASKSDSKATPSGNVSNPEQIFVSGHRVSTEEDEDVTVKLEVEDAADVPDADAASDCTDEYVGGAADFTEEDAHDLTGGVNFDDDDDFDMEKEEEKMTNKPKRGRPSKSKTEQAKSTDHTTKAQSIGRNTRRLQLTAPTKLKVVTVDGEVSKILDEGGHLGLKINTLPQAQIDLLKNRGSLQVVVLTPDDQEHASPSAETGQRKSSRSIRVPQEFKDSYKKLLKESTKQTYKSKLLAEDTTRRNRPKYTSARTEYKIILPSGMPVKKDHKADIRLKSHTNTSNPYKSENRKLAQEQNTYRASDTGKKLDEQSCLGNKDNGRKLDEQSYGRKLDGKSTLQEADSGTKFDGQNILVGTDRKLNKQHKISQAKVCARKRKTTHLKFPCPHCELTYGSLRGQKKHLKQKHKDVLIKCDQCDQLFGHKQEFVTHFEKAHTVQNCEHCGIEIEKGKYFLHLREFHRETMPTCDRCNVQFSNFEKLKLHIEKRHNKETFKCEECNKCFNTSQKLKAHEWYCVKKETHSITCELCGKISTTYLLYRDHMRFSHPETEPVQPVNHDGEPHKRKKKAKMIRTIKERKAEKPIDCEHCNMLLRKDSINYHMKRHHPDAPKLSCPEKNCKTTFRSKWIYDRHMSLFHVTCQTCGKTFLRKCELDAHTVLRHQSRYKRQPKIRVRKPKKTTHLCHLCGKVNKTFGCHKAHMLYHSSVKFNQLNKMKCKDCSKQFYTVTSYMMHIKMCASQLQQRTCDICKQIFRCNAHMETHKLLNHDPKQMLCRHCGKVYRNITAVIDHLKVCPIKEENKRLGKDLTALPQEYEIPECVKLPPDVALIPVERSVNLHISAPVKPVEGDSNKVQICTGDGKTEIQLDTRCVLFTKKFLTLTNHSTEKILTSKSRKGRKQYPTKPYAEPKRCERYPECDKVFYNCDSYAKHRRHHILKENKAALIAATQDVSMIHLIKKPYACDQCSRRYAHKTGLADHKKQVHGSGQHVKCPVCSRQFGFKSSLVKHMNNIEVHRSYVCPECGRKIKTKKNFQKHVVEIHGKLLTETETDGYAREDVKPAVTVSASHHSNLQPHHDLAQENVTAVAEIISDHQQFPVDPVEQVNFTTQLDSYSTLPITNDAKIEIQNAEIIQEPEHIGKSIDMFPSQLVNSPSRYADEQSYPSTSGYVQSCPSTSGHSYQSTAGDAQNSYSSTSGDVQTYYLLQDNPDIEIMDKNITIANTQ